jgi:hypothetical protein
MRELAKRICIRGTLISGEFALSRTTRGTCWNERFNKCFNN